MRICIFTDSFLPYCSGVTYAVINQARELAERGHEVSIFRPRPWRERKVEPADLPPAVKVIDLPLSLPIPNVPKLYVTLPTFVNTLWRLRKLKPDVVHVNTEWGCGWEGVMAARLLSLPAVGTFHTFFAEPGYLKAFGLPNNRIMRNIMWNYSIFFFNRCHALTSPSAAVRDALVRHGVRTIPTVTSNGISKPPLLPDDQVQKRREEYELTGPTFAYIGRISPEKSLDVLLKAFALVVAQCPAARLVLIGDGPFRFKLKRLIRSLGLEQHAKLLGYVPHDQLLEQNLPRLGDVFVTASKTENQPLSIMEAMAFGLPVIGPRAKGIPELVEDGRDGLLFEPDDVQGLADVMLKCSRDPERRRQMARNARRSVGEHMIERAVDRLESVYRRAIAVAHGKPVTELEGERILDGGEVDVRDPNSPTHGATSDRDSRVASPVGHGDF